MKRVLMLAAALALTLSTPAFAGGDYHKPVCPAVTSKNLNTVALEYAHLCQSPIFEPGAKIIEMCGDPFISVRLKNRVSTVPARFKVLGKRLDGSWKRYDYRVPASSNLTSPRRWFKGGGSRFIVKAKAPGFPWRVVLSTRIFYGQSTPWGQGTCLR